MKKLIIIISILLFTTSAIAFDRYSITNYPNRAKILSGIAEMPYAPPPPPMYIPPQPINNYPPPGLTRIQRNQFRQEQQRYNELREHRARQLYLQEQILREMQR